MTAQQQTSNRSAKVNSFRVMTVMHRAAELEATGQKIIHMEVGEPDFTTAEPIIDAAKRALDKGYTRYTAAPGIIKLRHLICEHYQQNYGVDLGCEQILITPGASGGLMLLTNLLVESGAGILISDPAYPCVRNFIHLAGGQPQLVPVGRSENFQPTVELLTSYVSESTRGVWLASPGNPTGTIVDREQLSAIARWASSHNCHLLVDEIYHGLHYVDDLPTALEIDPSAFVVNSFSKYFGMTGWRLGWIVVPESCVEVANRLAQNLFISSSSIAQHAALAAFEPQTREILESRRDAFRLRRNFLAQSLRELGFGLSDRIDGAFYLYASIERFSSDSEAFCHDLLERFGVAITPGTDFGEQEGLKHVRFAFTTGMDELRSGVDRLAQALGR